MTSSSYSDITAIFHGLPPLPTLCLPLCIGPYPSATALSSYNYPLTLVNPVALQLNFGLTITPEIYDSGENDSTSLDADTETATTCSPPTNPPTPPPEGYIHYEIADLNPNYMKLSIFNSTQPIVAAAFYSSDWTGENGSWINMNYGGQYDPYWYGNGPISFPLKLSISSASSELFDSLPYLPHQEIVGRIQF
eukprot:Phypoly_transcript_22772.p1 GENE.Phypoly_transcript_22772~~Phypoly_transcript_22772.p1  ORF type:complete len:193 (+),score=28.04 Phypoly_transcript_22772:2-580(+)